MGGALAAGWVRAGAFENLHIVDPNPTGDICALVANSRADLNPSPAPADIVVLAVKPQGFPEAAATATDWIGRKSLVVSIMAGVRMATLVERLGAKRVIRAMPNTPGAIGQGVSVLAAPANATPKDIKSARALLSPLGDVLGPVDEALMPAVTAVSGSGPAYIFLLAEAMAAAGEADGLPADLAQKLARETVIGSAGLLAASDASAADLRRQVTSAGGTTEAALDVLMAERGMPHLLRQAIRAAAQRERALSGD